MIVLKTIKSKLEQATRLLFINSISISNKSVLIVEYPKSGGTWLGQLVSNYLELPFPRNKFPSLKRSVWHGHYLPKWNIKKNKKIIFLVRDGRDVIVSLYYHQLIWNEKNKLNPKDVLFHRKRTGFSNFEEVQKNLEAFIQYTYTQEPSKIQHFTYMGNWFSYNRAWLNEMKKGGNNIYLVTYEGLLKDTYGTLEKMFAEFFENDNIDSDRLKEVVEKFSFENLSKRKKGEENKNSFLRKGISGDWKNYFTEKEKETFKKYTEDLLVELGYENNNDW